MSSGGLRERWSIRDIVCADDDALHCPPRQSAAVLEAARSGRCEGTKQARLAAGSWEFDLYGMRPRLPKGASNMYEAVRAMWMRGGTSKGGYFLASDLPPDPARRDELLLGIMGSPDPRQIDGMGGADALTSKVAVVAPSSRTGVDVDYLFLQVFVDRAIVTDAQNCGNILAGVGPFAVERGLVAAGDDETSVSIHMENSGRTAIARFRTPGRVVDYRGDSRIDGVPGSAAPVKIEFCDTAGSSCGSLLPTGNASDVIDGVEQR